MRISLEVLTHPDIDKLRNTLETYKDKDNWQLALMELRDNPKLHFFYESLVANRNPLPYRSLFRILKRFQVTHILVETPYLDVDFWDTYAHFHSRSFRESKKRGLRIHFFHHDDSKSSPCSLEEMLYAGNKQTEIENNGFTYCGSASIRPTDSFNLGRVAVPFATTDDNGSAYLKGVGEEIANVASSQLCIRTVPFVQQDPMAGLCATASLWVASQVLANKFELNKYPYITISRYATRQGLVPTGGPIFSEYSLNRGLTTDEISHAFSITGAVPFTVETRLLPYGKESAIIRDYLYIFVESELPVILCFSKDDQRPGHAVTVIGHSQSSISTTNDLSKCTVSSAYVDGSEKHFLVSQSVNRFYAHDDRYGPFNRIEFPLNTSDRRFGCPLLIKAGEEDKPELHGVLALVAPMPPYIKNSPEGVMQDAWVRFSKLFGGLLQEEDKILWRIFLIKGSRFKQSLVGRYPDPLILAYSETHLPKYVWLCEISVFSENNFQKIINIDSGNPRPIRGEFLYDTTTPFYQKYPIVQRFQSYFVTKPGSDRVPPGEWNTYLRHARVPNFTWDHDTPCFTGSPQG